MHSSTNNLLFLLATGPMALACAPTGDESSDEETSGDGDGDGDSTAACEAYGAQVAICYESPPSGVIATNECLDSIAYYSGQYGADCEDALVEFYVCLSALSCEEFVDDAACSEERQVFEMACQ